MAELGYTKAQLPSRGALYDDKIPDGEVGVRKLSSTEEELLLSSGSRGMERMEQMLAACVKLPNEFPHEELLMSDRMAALLALRTITFGPHYEFNYKCQFCNTMQKADINILEDLEEQTPDQIVQRMREKLDRDDFQLAEPFEVTLPDNGAVLTMRFLRGKDEKRLVKKTKRTMMQSVDRGDQSYLYRFALQIVTINGEDVPISKKEAFIRSPDVTAKDTATMRIAVDEREPKIDLRVYPDCRGCGATNELGMPFTGEFFQPTKL